jgi:hypothetical protein
MKVFTASGAPKARASTVCLACKKVRVKCEPVVVTGEPGGPSAGVGCRRCLRLGFTCRFKDPQQATASNDPFAGGPFASGSFAGGPFAGGPFAFSPFAGGPFPGGPFAIGYFANAPFAGSPFASGYAQATFGGNKRSFGGSGVLMAGPSGVPSSSSNGAPRDVSYQAAANHPGQLMPRPLLPPLAIIEQPPPQPPSLPLTLEVLQEMFRAAVARRDNSAMAHILLLTGASGGSPVPSMQMLNPTPSLLTQCPPSPPSPSCQALA